jgi:glycosyltransferase involved in cell wall biosynthesis
MNIVFFQHGDFGEAYRRFSVGEAETYRDQRRTVDFVASFRDRHVMTTVAVCGREHREELDENLHSFGINRQVASSPTRMGALMQSLRPDMVVCRSPNLNVLRWVRRQNIPTLPLFADTFSNGNVRAIRQNLSLRQTLLSPVFPAVANHSMNASLSIKKALFFPADRIIPWDISSLDVEGQPKTRSDNSKTLSIFYAGILSEPKGVGDCLRAVHLLGTQGRYVTISFAGPGEHSVWQKEAESLGISDRVEFLGRVTNILVRQRMRESDIVVVPSRHDYPEGLPNTLCEGLASRTPVVISDHPAFASRLTDRRDCLIFAAGNAASLADRIAELAGDPALYATLSLNAPKAYASLYFGIEWTQLVGTFIADPTNATGWVEQNSLRRLLRDRGMPPNGKEVA